MEEQNETGGEILEPVDLEITDSLDLHAFRPKDTAAVLKIYLEEAKKARFKFVRIVHGKASAFRGRSSARYSLIRPTF